MRQRFAARHVAKFFLGCEVRFESLQHLRQFWRKRIGVCGQRARSCRSRTRRAQSEEIPARDLLMLAKEVFDRIHGAGFIYTETCRFREDFSKTFAKTQICRLTREAFGMCPIPAHPYPKLLLVFPGIARPLWSPQSLESSLPVITTGHLPSCHIPKLWNHQKHNVTMQPCNHVTIPVASSSTIHESSNPPIRSGALLPAPNGSKRQQTAPIINFNKNQPGQHMRLSLPYFCLPFFCLNSPTLALAG